MSVRTSKAFVPSLARPDDMFAANWLEPLEYRLYERLDPRERDHACLVAKAVLAAGAPPQVVRAALLHDLGKMGAFNPVERILVHLYTPGDIPESPELEGWRGAWQRNLHHARRGAASLRAVGGCERVAQLVERHHEPGNDAEAELLKAVEMRF